jgi:hypothetical protein
MVHQRTFSVHQQKVSPRQNDSPLDSVSLRHHQDSLQHRRYKHRRASEPLNLIGFGLGWTRGSDKKKRQSSLKKSTSWIIKDYYEPKNLFHIPKKNTWPQAFNFNLNLPELPPPSQSPFAYEDEASSPPASPASSIGGGGRSPAANSFSKSGAAANYPSRFFAHQHTIEESEEWEIDMDGQRRQSTSKRPQQQPIVEQQRYATVIRL